MHKYRSKGRQLLLLNEQGILIASCNSIFEANDYFQKPILPFFPLIESVFPKIIKLQEKDSEISFCGVETIFSELPGLYDFTFVRLNTGYSNLILWSIEDLTVGYRKKRTVQQLLNEKLIAEELLR